MKLQFNREKFFQAFSLASLVVAVRDVKPVLLNIKMIAENDQILFMATDLELGIRIVLKEDISVEESGSVMLSTKLFRKILQESKDSTLMLESHDNVILVNGERTHYHIPSLDGDDFPDIPVFSADSYHEVSRDVLRELIRRTVFAVDLENTKYSLGGVLIECTEGRIAAVSTDGRRLAYQEGNAGAVGNHAATDTSIFPVKILGLIEKSLGECESVRISIVENHVQIQCGPVTMSSQLIQGRFPRWRSILPETSTKERVDFLAGELLIAVRQAEIVASDKEPCVIFSFSSGTLKIEAAGAEIGESIVEMPICYEGPEITIKMDPRYLIDFLRVLPPEMLTSFYFEAGKPVLFTTEDGYSYLIMPLV